MNRKETEATVAPSPGPIRLRSKVSFSVRLGFGVGDFGFMLVWQGTALFLLYFYTDVLGISPEIAGLIYLVAMIWDAVSDPFIATLADRTQTNIGKYRPWLLFGALPFGVSYPLAFSAPPTWLPIGVVMWALITHVLLRTAYTIVAMPFSSLQARLTSDSQERTVLAGFRMTGAAFGGLFVALVTPALAQTYGEAREAEAYFIAACFVGGAAFLALIYCVCTMKEPKGPRIKEVTSIWEDLRTFWPLLILNPPLIRVFGIVVISSICMGMFANNILYHFKYHLNSPELAIIGLAIPALLVLASISFWVWLAGKTSKRFSLSAGTIIALVGYLGFFLNPTKDMTITLIMITLVALGSAALAVMFWAMLPDTVEYGEAKLGKRAEAKTFGLATFAQKAAVGINAILLGGLLGLVGYEANVEQSDATLLGMKAIMAIIPAAGAVAILWILRGYALDFAMHARLIAQLERKKTL